MNERAAYGGDSMRPASRDEKEFFCYRSRWNYLGDWTKVWGCEFFVHSRQDGMKVWVVWELIWLTLWFDSCTGFLSLIEPLLWLNPFSCVDNISYCIPEHRMDSRMAWRDPIFVRRSHLSQNDLIQSNKRLFCRHRICFLLPSLSLIEGRLIEKVSEYLWDRSERTE